MGKRVAVGVLLLAVLLLPLSGVIEPSPSCGPQKLIFRCHVTGEVSTHFVAPRSWPLMRTGSAQEREMC